MEFKTANKNILKAMTSVIAFISLLSCGEQQSSQLPFADKTTTVQQQPTEFTDPFAQQRKKVIKINFQPEKTQPAEGYLIDSGKVFAKKDNGFTYGWNNDVSKGIRKRGNFRSLDSRYDTLAHIFDEKSKISSTWEIKIPNGYYQIYIAAGDPSYAKDKQSINIENILIESGENSRIDKLVNVQVNDGKLTISSANNNKGYSSKLNYVDIYPFQISQAQLPPHHINNVELINLNTYFFAYWDNPVFNFSHNYLVQLDAPLEGAVPSLDNFHKQNVQVKNLGKAKNTLISINALTKFNYIFSANSSGELSTAKLLQLPLTQQKLPKHQLNENIVAAMELTKRWSKPDDIYQLHNLFAEHLFTHKVHGSKAQIISDSIWQHRSLNSAVFAFQTEKPTKAYVKYWNDKNAFTSTLSVRALYTHIHYLPHLIANDTYQFEVITETGSQEKVIYNGTIEPHLNTKQTEIIYTNQSTQFPIELNKPNTRYVLINNISVTNSAFKITANNIELDLNGFQINQTGNNNSTQKLQPIIATKRALSKLKIVNGTLIQSTKESHNKNYRVIYLDNIKQAEVAGISIDYSLPQTSAFYAETRDKKQLPYRHNIHHNQFIDKGWEVSNRHGSGGAVPISFKNEYAYNESSIEVSHNLILRTRQNGIQRATFVYANEIYTDSWSTNSFAIQPLSKPNKKSGRYQNNKIFLTGYHAIGFGWAHKDLLIENNYIEMQGINSSRNRWWEGFGDQNSLNGLRITNYGKGGQKRNNLKYYNNKIIGMARNGSMMRGTELFSDYSITDTEVRWSEIDIRAEDEESLNVSAVVAQGTRNKNHHPIIYKDSILRSNVAIVRFGDSYGRGKNHTFDNVTFEKISGNQFFNTFIFDGAYFSTGHKVINGKFLNGAKWDDVYWRKTATNSYYEVIDDKSNKTFTIRPTEWNDQIKRHSEVGKKKSHQSIIKR